MHVSKELGLLKEKKARITKAREAILKVVLAYGPISANKVLIKLGKAGLNVNKTTVYRELAFLLRNNVLKEVYLEAGIVHYESALLPHHHHLVCNNCGSVEEIDCVLDQPALVKKTKSKGFLLQTHKFELYGRCANCS